MILVALAWMYVVLMVAAVEASGSDGSFLGALFTVALYGLLPMSIVLYLMLSPARRRARRHAESADADAAAAAAAADAGESAQASATARDPESSAGNPPDGGNHATGDPVPAERKET